MPATNGNWRRRAVTVDGTLPHSENLDTPRLNFGATEYPFEAPTDPEYPLNIIIPIGGIGSRFQKEGYRFPKPLINIVGRPMICWLIERLSLRPQDTLWIAVNEGFDNDFQIGQLMKKWFPRFDIRLLLLTYLTKGAAETVSVHARFMRESLDLTSAAIYCHPKHARKSQTSKDSIA
jgi:choline kinase